MIEKEKNINVVIRDFKQDLVNLINDSGLPAFLIYEILNGLTLELNNQIQKEIRAAENRKEDSPS